MGVRVVIPYEVEGDIMLQQRLESRQKKRKSSHRIEGLLDHLIVTSAKTPVGDGYEGRTIRAGSELLLDG
jgi:hypothetical protein